MVRPLLLALAALLAASCGAAGRLSDGPCDPDAPLPVDEEIDQPVAGDPTPARECFDGLERIAENPIDPCGADLETLLSVPGLPEELARSVVAAAGKKRSAGTWIDRLTPRQREDLYRYRDYLVLPSRHPLRMSVRLTQNGVSAPGGTRKELYVGSSVGGWKALWRRKFSESGGGTAGCASGSAFGGAVRFHGGTFVPDFALGLVYGGSYQSYIFSASYPFHGSRRIAGSTSFASPAVLGGAAELQYRNVRGAFFTGRSRAYRTDHFESAEEPIFGARLEVQGNGGAAGLSLASGAAGGGRTVFAIDGRRESERTRLGFELGLAGRGEPALLSAFSYRIRGTHAALFLYSIPAGVSGRFGMVNGRTPGAGAAARGLTAAAERAVAARVRVRAAIERYNRDDGLTERDRQDLRAECERKWRRVTLKLTWISTADEHRGVIPYPGPPADDCETSSALGLVSDIGITGGVSARITLRKVEEEHGAGYLVSPLARASLLSGRLKVSASLARYRAIEGRAICYFYEPSLKGSYPWRVASDDREWYAFLIIYTINKLSVSCHAALEEGKPPEISLQAVSAF
jgi:hypothetical protein